MTDSVSMPHSMQPLSMAAGAALGLMLSACHTGDSPQSMATSTTDASVTASSATDTLHPVVVTAAVLNDSDDPVIWIDTLNPSRSLVIGTGKGDSTGVAFGGELIDTIVAAERGTGSRRIFGVAGALHDGRHARAYTRTVPVLSAIALSTVTIARTLTVSPCIPPQSCTSDRAPAD